MAADIGRSPTLTTMSVAIDGRAGGPGRRHAAACRRSRFDFAAGEIWALHTGWRGNQTHYAERGELILEPNGSYTSPWINASYGVVLDEVARRFHRYLRSRPQHPSSPRPVWRTAARLPDDKFPDESRVALGPLPVEYELEGRPGHLLDRLGDYGEGRPAELRLLGAVESDDREILRHAQATLVRGPQQADCLQVGAREDGGRRT